MKKTLATAFLAMAAPLMMMAQDKSQFEVTGKLSILNNSFPAQNITVVSQKTGDTAVSGKDGVFKILSCDNDELMIQQHPFKTVNRKIREKRRDDTVAINLAFPRKVTVLTKIIDDGYLDKSYEEHAYSKMIFRKDWTKYTDIEQAIEVEFPNLKRIRQGCYQLPECTAVNGDGCMLTIVGNREGDMLSIPITNVEDIYVVKGAQSAQWGIQGANGVLVVKIKNTDFDRLDKD